jgi:hypothetical protein
VHVCCLTGTSPPTSVRPGLVWTGLLFATTRNGVSSWTTTADTTHDHDYSCCRTTTRPLPPYHILYSRRQSTASFWRTDDLDLALGSFSRNLTAVSHLSALSSPLDLLVGSSSAVTTLDAAGKRRTSHERGNTAKRERREQTASLTPLTGSANRR